MDLHMSNWVIIAQQIEINLKSLWGEWPSGLRRCSKNQKVPGSNPTRRSAGLRDPAPLRGPRRPPGRKCKAL